MVLYFSGTGNSKYIAKMIAEKTKDSVYSVNHGVKFGQYPNINADELLIFSVPTYSWRIPRIVSDWIENGEIFSNQKVYFVLTCGDDIGCAEKYLKELCIKKNLKFMGCAGIRMPENYIAMFDCPPKEKERKIIKRAEESLQTVISQIQSGVIFKSPDFSVSDKIKSGIVNIMFYNFCVSSKKFTSSDKCIGCGKCSELCPTTNISIENGKPVWLNNCTHCMACICYCPTECIEYGKISLGKRRYKCPDYKSEN